MTDSDNNNNNVKYLNQHHNNKMKKEKSEIKTKTNVRGCFVQKIHKVIVTYQQIITFITF